MADGLVDQYGLILPFLAESKPTVFDCAPSRWLGVRLWRGVSPYIASHHTVREIEPRPTGPGHRAQSGLPRFSLFVDFHRFALLVHHVGDGFAECSLVEKPATTASVGPSAGSLGFFKSFA
jgi:hypothetical protein